MPTVDSKGRIVIPSDVRDRLGLGPGSEIVVTVEGDRVVVEPEDDPDDVVRELEAGIEAASAARERRRTAGDRLTDPAMPDPFAIEHRETIHRGADRDVDDARRDADDRGGVDDVASTEEQEEEGAVDG